MDRAGGGSRMEKEEQQPPEPDALPTRDAAAAAAGGARRNSSRSDSSSNYRDSTASPSGAGSMVDLIADASHLLGVRQEGVSTLESYAP